MVGQVAAMGFVEDDAKKALVLTKGDVAEAIDALTSGKDLEPASKKTKKVFRPNGFHLPVYPKNWGVSQKNNFGQV